MIGCHLLPGMASFHQSAISSNQLDPCKLSSPASLAAFGFHNPFSHTNIFGRNAGTKHLLERYIVHNSVKGTSNDEGIEHGNDGIAHKKGAAEHRSQPISSPSRRALLSSSLAVTLVANAGYSGKNHMARALVQTGQEKEESRLARSTLVGLQSRLATFSLDNGMRWIVLERHNAPVVTCHTYAHVGASSEADGCTGIAHLLEHLAFKGTKLVGTRDADKEAALLDQLDELFYSLQDARVEGSKDKAESVRKEFLELQAEAASLAIPNEYGALISRQGGVGLNAQTSQDATEYYVSLPANKLELWMALESGRFIAPVFRELYSEKEVVKEERRLRVDNTPYGCLFEAFTELAFPQLPYGRPVIGYPDDFEKIGRREVTQFFKENYSPKTLTCAVVGDVDPLEVERLARRYFGSWGASCDTEKEEPYVWRDGNGWDTIVRSEGQRSLNMRLPAQPFYMEGYYRPPASSSDDPAISVVDELLSGGRLSRLYKKLILAGKALSATSVEAFPGDQQPCLFLLYGTPPTGTKVESFVEMLHQELERLTSQGVLEEELVRVKKAARASLLELFGSNEGLAKLLCKYEATTGTCGNLFQENEFIEAVTPGEVHRVASLLFDPKNCIKGSVTNVRGRT